MINSRNSLYAVCALAAGAWFAPAAQAQPLPPAYPPPGATTQATGAPRTLPGAAQSPPPAGENSDAGTASTRIPARPGILGHSGGSAISVVSLGEVEGPPVGTLDSTNGGLGMDLWSGSARGVAEELMGRLPLPTTISSVRSLARRIVLTRAVTPIGEADQAFTTVRIRRLLHAGLLTDAANLAAMAQIPDDPGFARVQAEAILFAGQKGHACDDTTATRLDSAEPFWIELRAYCYAMSGDADALTLTRTVMDAQNINDDAFDTLLDDVENNVARDPGGIDSPTALHAFLLRQAGLPVGFDTGAQLGTPGLLMVLRSKDNSPEDRLRAAERIFATGALSGAELIALADAQTFSRDQFATEHAQVQKLPFLAGQALLRQAALRASPDVQPALIFEALNRAEAKGFLGIAATLQQDALSKLLPQPGLHGMADLFGRALMLTGHADAAARWITLFDPTLDSDRAQRAKFAVALNLVAPNPDRQIAAQGALDELAEEIAGKTQDEAYAALALGLYAALREPLSPQVQTAAESATKMEWPGRRPAASLMTRLRAAVRAPGRKGDALMLVLNAIGARGPGDLAPDVSVGLVRTLMTLGVPGAARGIAIDALLRYRPAPAPSAPPSLPPPAPQ